MLTTINFKPETKKDLIARVGFLKQKFDKIRKSDSLQDEINWIMGQVRPSAIGNINLTELMNEVSKISGQN